MITLLIIALLAIPVSLAFGDSHAGSNAAKPSVVLVHGAWADSSSWSAVIAHLQDEGYTVYSFPNPLRGLASDSAYLTSFLATITGPIILVGHSYGGAVITNAATGNSNVKALVYIDAFAPKQGETGLALLSMPPPLGQAASCVAADPTTVFNFVPLPNHDVDLYVKQSLFPSCFANDLPLEKAAVLGSAQRPLVLSSLTEQGDVPAWKTIPSWYLVGTIDHVIPSYLQLFMAQRANAHITQVNGSHLVMISHPEAVVDLIQQATQSTSGSDNTNSQQTLAPTSL
jgi:pimeloyl-ACP methyl ester carboxylesterase